MPTDANPTTPAWSPEQQTLLATWMADPWRYRAMRRMPLKRRLTDEQVHAAGQRIAEIDVSLVFKRQNKNAEQARLQREKKSREGALSSLANRVREGVDELGKPIDVAKGADYSRKMAALREEYDAFEESRKERMRSLRDELDELETEQQTISKRVSDGYGDVMVKVVDFADYGKTKGTQAVVVTVELETGAILHKRNLDDHEAQIGLLTGDEHPALSGAEWTLAIGGRLHDAARAYIGRTGLVLEVGEGIKLIRKMLPDEELPPEADDVTSKPDAPPAPDAPMFEVRLTDRTGKARKELVAALMKHSPMCEESEAKAAIKNIPLESFLIATVQGQAPAETIAEAVRAAGGVVTVTEKAKETAPETAREPDAGDEALPPEAKATKGKDAAAGRDL